MIQFLRGTQSQLNSSNQVFAAGQPIFESDTGQLKIGNGSSVFSALPYVGASSSGSYPIISPDADIFESYIDFSDRIRLHWGRFSVTAEIKDYDWIDIGGGWEYPKEIYPLTVSNRIGTFMTFSLEMTGSAYSVYHAANQSTSIYVTFLKNTGIIDAGYGSTSGQLAYTILDVVV